MWNFFGSSPEYAGRDPGPRVLEIQKAVFYFVVITLIEDSVANFTMALPTFTNILCIEQTRVNRYTSDLQHTPQTH
ncbi:hypothetical protein GN958_ATG17238 [Phytophthora infestans]|uniref:Uncharacterized protein n=1 Tax=Phytophthora infestans TaxID=4787 RepID=A0A8S9TYU5_PHYIN|nr:hypothetical protein GN958_ATG17238 [Phytophthora infestans]